MWYDTNVALVDAVAAGNWVNGNPSFSLSVEYLSALTVGHSVDFTIAFPIGRLPTAEPIESKLANNLWQI